MSQKVAMKNRQMDKKSRHRGSGLGRLHPQTEPPRKEIKRISPASKSSLDTQMKRSKKESITD